MLLHVANSQALGHHQTIQVMSPVCHGEIGSLNRDLPHLLTSLFRLNNWAKNLSRLSPKKNQMSHAVHQVAQVLTEIHQTKINSVFTNIDTSFLNLISSKIPLNGARSFCNSQGRT
ncbi:hypothetical protein EBI01_12450 [Marinomonas rhizomae]|uniref:Uncharacterized protein n=1 Tax=Marinomonas rhizomae TaxID=491948 RepID=A0A366J836_9GAMM|nr:hypothetical protein DFP80_10713 [Marinomonas rhizomae]RNF72648.1 hypothetical protein EBI01_12450 [Marinomonas rhizomae]